MKKYAIIHLTQADSLRQNQHNQGGWAVASGEDPFTQLKFYSGITKKKKKRGLLSLKMQQKI
jgi:hypothetical protein